MLVNPFANDAVELCLVKGKHWVEGKPKPLVVVLNLEVGDRDQVFENNGVFEFDCFLDLEFRNREKVPVLLQEHVEAAPD